GAGQAGLSAGFHLQHRGFVPVRRAVAGDRTFVILDAEKAAVGAWRHRWDSLTMATVNGIHELPGYPVPEVDPRAPSRECLPGYFADYEECFARDVLRRVRVGEVRRGTPRPSPSPEGRLVVVTDTGAAWIADHVINATGTWSRPFWPHYPGRA